MEYIEILLHTFHTNPKISCPKVPKLMSMSSHLRNWSSLSGSAAGQVASELAAGNVRHAQGPSCELPDPTDLKRRWFQPERTKGKTQRQNFSVEQLGSDAPHCAAPADGIVGGG